MIDRRKIIFLGLSAFALPFPARSQQRGKVFRIGFLYNGSRQSAMSSGRYGAFLQGMRELGYVEGKHFVIEGRFAADGEYERVPGLAAELVGLNLDVIVAGGVPSAQALRQATTTIPIVAAISQDPVREGLAASFARPGRNVTGLAAFVEDVFPKHVELLKLAIPKLSRIAALAKPGQPGHPPLIKSIEATARKYGIQVLRVDVAALKDLEPGFATMARERAEALIIMGDSFFVQIFPQIAALAIRHRLASTFHTQGYPESGGLMSYGPNLVDNFRRAAIFVDKILKGARPGDLPFEQPTRFYLTINRKTAKAIGLAIPQELLLRADRVIE